MKYFFELKKAMNYLSSKKNTIFLGQAVAYPGTAMYGTLQEVNKKKLIELPVFEETQLGLSIGLSLNNFVPISIYPRWNFLILAMNQLVNHLDKLQYMSSEKIKNKVIIRTSIGSERPLDPQHQHKGDFTDSIKNILTNVEIIKLEESKNILNAYKYAFHRKDGKHTVLVEYADYYNEK
ncbi:MAG: hypothetical protein CMI57_00810 [Parcubacteria group bacterium]|nr:hypothetical protein [Parcubacteria group bacterium]